MLENLSVNQRQFVLTVFDDLINRVKRNKKWYEKIARQHHIEDKNQVKELTELAISLRARELAQQPFTSDFARYRDIVELYENQVNLSHRTSQSILFQQYSTPAPVSYLAGLFCNAAQANSIFEPSAGNGLLCHTAPYARTVVNENDPVRNAHLKAQDFQKVTAKDATEPFTDYHRKFDVVLTNPPFGKLLRTEVINGYYINQLEHLMAIRALECMKDDGRAAIIIGGFASYDEKKRLKGANRVFLNYLYANFDVRDIINIYGRELYSRQGTAFNVRLILIDGRKSKSGGAAPVFSAERENIVKDFHTLYQRVITAKAQCVAANSWEFKFVDWFNARMKLGEFTPKDAKEMQEYHQSTVNSRLKNGKYVALDALSDYPELQHSYPVVKSTTKQSSTANQINTLQGVASDGKYRIYLKSTQTPHRHYAFDGTFSTRNEAEQFSRRLIGFLSRDEHPLHCSLLAIVPKDQTLGAPYLPASEACVVLDTVVPDAMSYATHDALEQIRKAVGGDLDEFVRIRLGYPSHVALCKALAAEQIDAVAMAIYNVEARQVNGKGQGMIVGDQTGIGKGRIAAAMIRYAVKRGLNPLFITEKPNLYTDLYRDLTAIGSADLVPFIVNAKEAKSIILDQNGKPLFTPPDKSVQKEIFVSGILPDKYDFIMSTYSQLSDADESAKKKFVKEFSRDNIFILDEAHNASGTGNTGRYLQDIVSESDGVLFLSATFAKKPENLPLFALKTVLSQVSMSSQALIGAIRRGGVALQELIAAEMVNEGQMLRRERSNEGVEVNYIMLDDNSEVHRAISDSITDIIRDIIKFQQQYVTKQVDSLDSEAALNQEIVKQRGGTENAGIDNKPYYSKVFQVISQMLFSIKAKSVALRAIERLKEGKKPIIAFSSTMESFVESAAEEQGEVMQENTIIDADFSEVLRRGLNGVMRYTIIRGEGDYSFEQFTPEELGSEAEFDYARIMDKIRNTTTGISVSPIDEIVQIIRSAGYSIAEVTGRKYELELFNRTGELGRYETTTKKANRLKGRIQKRKRMVTNEAYRLFNNNKIDVLLINQSGSTGASAHAIPTDEVPPEQVKQRVMIIVQPELDIATEVQKRGRIHRTGQLYKPIYDYLTSNIPAEQRLMMMLQRKLKSLDANTSSNQKQSKNILDVPDFLNVYGGQVIREYLEINEDVNKALGFPLSNVTSDYEAVIKVSGRVAILSTDKQHQFYAEIINQYNELIEYLKQTGEYDLELTHWPLQAKTLEKTILIAGKGGTSVFSSDTYLEECEVNVLRKPYRFEELKNVLRQSLNNQSPEFHQQTFLAALNEYYRNESQRRISALEQEQRDKIIALEKNIEEEERRLKDESVIIQGENSIQEVLDVNFDDEQTGEEDENTAESQKLAKLNRLQQKLSEAKLNAEKRIDNLRGGFELQLNFLRECAEFFTIGKQVNYFLNYDYFSDEETSEDSTPASNSVKAIFVGFKYDLKRNKALSPGNVRLQFAIAGSMKSIVIPASKKDIIRQTISLSNTLEQVDESELETFWVSHTAKSMRDRETRYIITGNVIQALDGISSGSLIRFTTIKNEERIGIFMPDGWSPTRSSFSQGVDIPATKALKIIQSMTVGSMKKIGKKITLFRDKDVFRLAVKASKNVGGEVFLHPELIALSELKNFNKSGNMMVAKYAPERIEDVLKIIENDFNETIIISKQQFANLLKSESLVKNETPPRFPKLDLQPAYEVLPDKEPQFDEPENEDEELELEAQALTLALALQLQFKQKNRFQTNI
jgi:hypothetical protein